MATSSLLVGVLVLVALLSFVECQQRPLKPLQYYAHITTVYTYETYKAEIAFDEPRERYSRKEFVKYFYFSVHFLRI